MHELGIVGYVIREVEDIARENGISRVASVKLEIGEVSGIIPDYLKDCWDWMIKRGHPVLEETAFEWDTDPAVTFCEDCRRNYETVRYGKTCPHCGSGRTYLLKGNGLKIKEIAVYDEG